MKISTLLRHVLFAERQRLTRQDHAAALGVNINTLSAWKYGQRPTLENEARIREYCARIHRCAQCEGAPDELRDAPDHKPAPLDLSVDRKERPDVYQRRYGTFRTVERHGEAITKYKSDADAVANATRDGARVFVNAEVVEVRGRWRVMIGIETESAYAESSD